MSFATHTPSTQSEPYVVCTWTLTTTRGPYVVEDGKTFVNQMSNWKDGYLLQMLACASRSHTIKPIDIEGAYWIARQWNGTPCSFEYDNCTFTKGA